MSKGRVTTSSVESAAHHNKLLLQCAVDECQQPLLRYAQSFVKDYEIARDIVQHALMKLHEQSDPPGETQLKPWLYRVCRNAAIDYLRKEQRMTKTPLQDREFTSNQSQGPAEIAEQKETLQVVMDEVATLSANQQEVLRLKFQSGFSYKEIAEVTGLTSSNVGVLLHTAIRKLKDKLMD